MDYNILSWLIWLPVIGVAVIAFVPRDKEELIKIVSALATGLQFLLTLVLWNNFNSSNGLMQFEEKYDWIPSFNIEYYLGVDGLKTGHTTESGYGLVASSELGERRVTFVIAGTNSKEERKLEGEKLLQWAYRDFKIVEIFPENHFLGKAPVWIGSQDFVELKPRTDFTSSEGEENFTLSLNNNKAQSTVAVRDSSILPEYYFLESDKNVINEGEVVEIELTTRNILSPEGKQIPFTGGFIVTLDVFLCATEMLRLRYKNTSHLKGFLKRDTLQFWLQIWPPA